MFNTQKGLSSLLIALYRYIYTDRALSESQTLAAKLFNQPLYILQQLSNTVGLARLIIVITVSCLLGITMGLGALRSYQATATLPTTLCGESSRCTRSSLDQIGYAIGTIKPVLSFVELFT